MSEDELQLDEENNEMENLDKDENKEDSNIENDINIGQEKEQNKDQGEDQENIEENNEDKGDMDENENKKINDSKDNKEEINIIQNNDQQKDIDDEVENKELTMISINKNNNKNINMESFAKSGYFEENSNINFQKNKINNEYLHNKNTKQLLSEINNDMDLLEKNLSPIYKNYEIAKENNFYNIYNNNQSNYSEDTEQQNYEIKKLIQKANKLINKNNSSYYSLDYFQKNNKYENGGNYINCLKGENISSNDDSGYIRNLYPEKNINKHRIQNFNKLYEYNNKNYYDKPIIYNQRETIPIKNSYMDEYLGQPQTFQKYEYPNNLVFSSDKISFRKIKPDNINSYI